MSSTVGIKIPRGVSVACDPVRAAQELHDAIRLPETALGLFFCSPDYEPDALALELQRRFGETRLIGCTTAGEITPVGYLGGSITGAAFPAGDFAAASALIERLEDFEVSEVPRICARLLSQLTRDPGALSPHNTFGLLLIDGLSLREESVVSAFYNCLGQIPIFGGSAGDGLAFRRTRIFADGAFHENAAVFTLIHTRHPFRVFKTQHFVGSQRKMVVTGANVARRVVTEINGEPAAVEYARMVGVPVEELGPTIFAANPVVVRIGGADFVRAIQRVERDRSLTMFCAIDEGLVLSLAEGVDLAENLESVLARLRGELGELELVIGCDCILRRLEMERLNCLSHVGRLLAANQALGFCTYGEQYQAMHINQTFTGVAIAAGVSPYA